MCEKIEKTEKLIRKAKVTFRKNLSIYVARNMIMRIDKEVNQKIIKNE